MGYRIEYDGNMVEKTVLYKKKRWKLVTWIVAVVAVFGCLLLPRGRELTREVLIPGDDQITIQALERYVDDLKAGTSFVDATESFCREILQNGT